jgi:hypothetical protein
MIGKMLVAVAGAVATSLKLRRKPKHRHHRSTWSDRRSKPAKLRVYNDCSFQISLYWSVTTLAFAQAAAVAAATVAEYPGELNHLHTCQNAGSTMKGRCSSLALLGQDGCTCSVSGVTEAVSTTARAVPFAVVALLAFLT